MILYHYTSVFHLPGIIASQAIAKGDVPISEDKGFQAPWLTTNGDRSKIVIPSNVCKTGARITVALPETDQSLIKWTDVIQRWKISPAYAEILNKTGGKDADSWYIYWGFIRREKWVEIAILGTDDKYHPVSAEALAYQGNVPNYAMQVNMTEI